MTGGSQQGEHASMRKPNEEVAPPLHSTFFSSVGITTPSATAK